MVKVDIATAAVPKWQKYHNYTLEVDENQDDKATEIRLCSFERCVATYFLLVGILDVIW